MSSIKFGQQTYAWIMCGDKYMGKIDHMAKIASQAGYEGLEPINLQLGENYDPKKLRDSIYKHGIVMPSITLVCDWLNPKETEAEKIEADKLINIAAQFEDCMLMPVQMPQKDRNNLSERQKNLMSCVNEIAKRAADKGLKCTYHPNSPEGSIWRTREDYDKLLPMLDTKYIKWTPDVGHIAKGGMDPVQLMREYRSLINHVHFKDMNKAGEWTMTGEGDIDYETVVKDLVKANFDGWVIFEDECDRAVEDPDGVAIDDGKYIQNVVKAWIKEPVLA